MKSTLIPLILTALITASCKPEKSQASATESNLPAKATCLVSGEELGTMGIPPELDYHGRQIKFCCKSCIPKFNADPEKYLAKLK